MEKKTNKNYYIELLRFIFCMIIIVHHSPMLPYENIHFFGSGGVLGDAFFILTGYFTCRHLSKIINADSLDSNKYMAYSMGYTMKKLIRTLPYVCCGVFIAYAHDYFYPIANPLVSFPVFLSKLWNMLGEIFFLSMTGSISPEMISFLNSPLWYLSALFLALPLVMYISLRFKDVFRGYLVWILPFVIEGYMVHSYGGALPWPQYSGFVYSGALRGFSSLTMGFAVCYGADFLGKKYADISKTVRILLTVLELSLLSIVLYNVYRGIQSYDEVGTIVFIAIVFMLSFSGLTYTSKLNFKLLGYLGELSLPVYCIHWGILRWGAVYLGGFDYKVSLAIVVFVSLMVAVILNFLIKVVQRKKQAKV